MKELNRTRIVFHACHSSTVLLECWQNLKDHAECHWVTDHPKVYAELKSIGCQNIADEQQFSLIRIIVSKFKRKIKSFFSYENSKNYLERTLQSIESISPDIVITNTILILAKYIPRNPKTMKVQVFHSVPYKTHIIIPETLNYDLILLPSEYHKKRLINRFKIKNTSKFKTVGWPRTDYLINNSLSKHKKISLLKKFNLNPLLKTVSYAPTWDAFHEKGLFPSSFGVLNTAFNFFCREIKKFNVNLVIRLHPCSHQLIEEANLHKIAEKYDVSLFYKKQTNHLDNTLYDFLSITDVLISDISGIITDFMVLNRPIIYIEPEVNRYKEGKQINWQETDLPREFRAGAVVDSMDDLISNVKQSLNGTDEYKFIREEILQKLFYKLDGCASQRSANTILEYYNQFRK